MATTLEVSVLVDYYLKSIEKENVGYIFIYVFLIFALTDSVKTSIVNLFKIKMFLIRLQYLELSVLEHKVHSSSSSSYLSHDLAFFYSASVLPAYNISMCCFYTALDC